MSSGIYGKQVMLSQAVYFLSKPRISKDTQTEYELTRVSQKITFKQTLRRKQFNLIQTILKFVE